MFSRNTSVVQGLPLSPDLYKRSGKRGSLTNTPDTLPLLKGEVSSFQTFDIQKILKWLIPLALAHQELQSLEFTENDSYISISLQIIEKLDEILPDEAILAFNNESLQPFVMLYLSNTTEYANMIAISGILELRKKNKRLFNITLGFFALCYTGMGIDLWLNDDDTWCLDLFFDSLEEELSEDSEDNEDFIKVQKKQAASLKSDVLHFTIFSAHELFLGLSKDLTLYHPTKTVYKNLKNWMLKGIHFYENGFTMSKYIDHRLTEIGSLHPDQYCRFIWDLDDMLGQSVCEHIDSIVEQEFIFPMGISFPLTVENFESLMTSDPIAELRSFYDWMNQGHKVFNDLF